MANSTTITKKVLGASGQAWHYVMSNVQTTPGVERCAWGELRAAVSETRELGFALGAKEGTRQF